MWRWLKAHSWLIWVAVIGTAGFVLAAIFLSGNDRPKFGDLLTKLGLEKKLINEKARVAKLVAKEGHAAAADDIKQKYKNDIAKLDEAETKKIEELKDDPEAMVDAVLRATL
jgi:gas vesicle protein